MFTDVVMPGRSTREFARRAQEMRPGLKVLYTRATRRTRSHNGRLDDDANLLSKPYRKDELARKLRSLLDGTPRSGEAPIVHDGRRRCGARCWWSRTWR